MKNSYEFYRQMLDNHGGRLVKIVALPLPPCPAHGVIYMPDSFTSKSFDGIPTFQSSHHQLQVLSCKRTEYGPAILAFVRLCDLIDFNSRTGYLNCKKIAICARVSYRILCEDNYFTMADDISLESVDFGGSSCHPGSHIVIPKAPHLTAMAQYHKSPHRGELDNISELEVIQYMDPTACELEFSEIDFSMNSVVDALISRCLISPTVSAYDVFGGLGEWAAPFLKGMRKNVLSKESCHEFVTSKGEILCH